MKKESDRLGELEDKLKQAERRIEELKQEIDEQRDLIRRMAEHAEDYDNTMESWCDSFDFELNDNGDWTNGPYIQRNNQLLDDYNKLVDKWNRYVPLINGNGGNPVGRPLGAAPAQVETVRKLHKRGASLRDIMIETSLGFSTVRTIVGQINGNDRTTTKHRKRLGLERIEIDKTERASQRRKRRQMKALPGRVQAVIENGRALVTEAKGLGKAK